MPGAVRRPHEIGPVNGLGLQVSNARSIVGPPLVAAVATRAGGWSLSPLVLSSVAAVCLIAGLAARAGTVADEVHSPRMRRVRVAAA